VVCRWGVEEWRTNKKSRLAGRRMETKSPPLTGPALRGLNAGFSPLYESLSEHLEVPKQKGGDGKNNEDGLK